MPGLPCLWDRCGQGYGLDRSLGCRPSSPSPSLESSCKFFPEVQLMRQEEFYNQLYWWLAYMYIILYSFPSYAAAGASRERIRPQSKNEFALFHFQFERRMKYPIVLMGWSDSMNSIERNWNPHRVRVRVRQKGSSPSPAKRIESESTITGW